MDLQSMSSADPSRFRDLDFQGFAALARDPTLSKYEKIGFPDNYRRGCEPAIFADIVRKLPNLSRQAQVVVDIGPGCSDLPIMMLELCERSRHEVVLIDSMEMLNLLPDREFVKKVAGLYPACSAQLLEFQGRVNAILCYSVLQYVIVDSNVFDFLDLSLKLLASGGEMLIGDVPNESKRERFLKSKEGFAFQKRGADNGVTLARSARSDGKKIDDAVVLALVARARDAGAHAYVVEQALELPMANRREDIIIRKP